ncbi:MAG TPA: hypothetical protein PKE06_10875 [Flavilitoribacter sp.]|nr:hypothetical protein [Flavilitoribacter sp.]HMQ87696.1 hypothetical protein [Flavilitoribacter sp.]
MITKDEVEIYLRDLSTKIDIWGLLFRSDRDKNLQTLLDLELSPNAVKEIIKALNAADYVEGPKKDTLNDGPDLWVFGKLIKRKEIYIKVTIGFLNAQAVCISFHTAEFPLHFPFK